MAKQDVAGLHLFAGNSSAFSRYRASAVAKYVLFGKDGKVLTADAPRPSEAEKVTALIDEALKE